MVELDEVPESTLKSGLILLPGTAALGHVRQRCAVVRAVGPGFTDKDTGELVEPQWKPGDHVMLNKHGGYSAQPADPKCRFYIVHQNDILGEVEPCT